MTTYCTPEIRAHLKAMRINAGVSMVRFQELTGVNRGTLHGWERGLHTPEPENFTKWAKAVRRLAHNPVSTSPPGSPARNAPCPKQKGYDVPQTKRGRGGFETSENEQDDKTKRHPLDHSGPCV